MIQKEQQQPNNNENIYTINNTQIIENIDLANILLKDNQRMICIIKNEEENQTNTISQTDATEITNATENAKTTDTTDVIKNQKCNLFFIFEKNEKVLNIIKDYENKKLKELKEKNNNVDDINFENFQSANKIILNRKNQYLKNYFEYNILNNNKILDIYNRLPWEALKDKNLNSNDKILFAKICNILSKKDIIEITYNNTELSKLSNICNQSTGKSLANLEKNKFINVKYNKSGSCRKITINQELVNIKTYLKIYDRVLFYPMLISTEMIFYSYLLQISKLKNNLHLNENENSIIKQDSIYDTLNTNRTTLKRTLESLKNLGLIDFSKIKNGYKFTIKVDLSKIQPEEIKLKELQNSKIKDFYKSKESKENIKSIVNVKDVDFEDVF